MSVDSLHPPPPSPPPSSPGEDGDGDRMAAVERRARPRPRRRRRWLSSIVVLLVVSFLAVVAPLVVAIGIGVVNVNRLSEGAADALNESTPLASRSKQIALDVRELQRHSQYAATIGPDNDAYPSLVNAFARSQERLAANIRELLADVDDPHAQAQLEALLARSASLVGNVGTNPRDPAQQALIDEMYDLSAWWASHVEERSRAQSERMREAAESTSQTLQRLLVIAIPTALLLIVLFTFLISTSLRQITRAIKQLGENQFDDPIRVRGPADLRTLGDELDALRLRLHQAELQKQRFLRHMSHELKTPLASLLEGTELFVDGSLGDLPTAQSEVAGILRSNAQELRHLIENLLDYSAWQSHGGTLRCTEFDLSVLCAQVLDQYQLMMRARSINVEQRIVPMTLHADRDKLRTVLSNLVSNAVKYTPAQGTIYVRAWQTGRNMLFELADSGPNIPPGERGHVFEPFFTGTPPQQAHLKGSGIGLSLVREYVRAHGGTVDLVDGMFPGAHFRISMPLCAQSGPVRLSA